MSIRRGGLLIVLGLIVIGIDICVGRFDLLPHLAGSLLVLWGAMLLARYHALFAVAAVLAGATVLLGLPNFGGERFPLHNPPLRALVGPLLNTAVAWTALNLAWLWFTLAGAVVVSRRANGPAFAPRLYTWGGWVTCLLLTFAGLLIVQVYWRRSLDNPLIVVGVALVLSGVRLIVLFNRWRR
ncbi:MAG: hypothetical protein PHU85_16255, partial [Phycisphaerae bacterium]|nr:hypothetical protein [Phycisphaerae bacterium]